MFCLSVAAGTRVLALTVAVLLAGGCGGSVAAPASSPDPATGTSTTAAPAPTRSVATPPPTLTPPPPADEDPPATAPQSTPTHEPPAASPTPLPTTTPRARWEQVPYRVELRTTDAATAGFAEDLHAVLTDPRGWVRAGFDFVEDNDAPYVIVLAEGPEVDALCAPLDTRATYSCQNGPVVALNADRWRSATSEWTGDLLAYRAMLVNHEVGHLLHLHHPTEHCPAPGLPAPVMAQQSTELGDCLPNPWPLQWEVDLAAQRGEPLAPPAEHDPSDHRPTPPPVDH